jgi:hypothetical protein
LPKNIDAIAFEYALLVLCNVNVSAPLPYEVKALVPLNFTTSFPVTDKLEPLKVKFAFPNTPVPPVATVKTLENPVEPTIDTEPPPAAAGPVGPVAPAAPAIPVGPVTVLAAPVGPVNPVGPTLGKVVPMYEMVEPLNPSVNELDTCVVAYTFKVKSVV